MYQLSRSFLSNWQIRQSIEAEFKARLTESQQLVAQLAQS